MVTLTKKNKVKLTGIPIVDEANAWNDEQNAPLPKWQMDELDKTDAEIKSGKIKYYSLEESHKRIMSYIDGLFRKN